MTKPVLRLPANTCGRDFVVGDIHGIFDVLDAALLAAKFDPARDRLICVGDLIDRGAQSSRVLEYLAQPWFYSISGNHEQMFLYAMRDGKLDRTFTENNIPNGLGWMLEETPEKLLAIARAFLALPHAIEIAAASGKPEDRIGFVHADVPAGMHWDSFMSLLETHQPRMLQIAHWSRDRINTRDRSGVAGLSRVFMGHTTTTAPLQLGNCFFIDTGGVFRMVNKPPKGQDLFLSLIETTADAHAITAVPNLAADFRVVAKRPIAPRAPRPPKP